MEWSYSGSKLFHSCQRRWYFHHIVANSHPQAKNRIRREAYLLSQLQSIEAWRGSIVDTVIEKEIVRPLNQVGRFSEYRVMKYAREVMEKQLKFARAFRSREKGMSKTKGGDEYAALYNLEYGLPIQEAALEQAWSDIHLALTHLMANDEIMTVLTDADYLVAQRSLYKQGEGQEKGITFKAIPDLIAFYENEPPVIIDWKVHAVGQREYWLQLGCYALALTQSEPHADFTTFSPNQYQPTDLRLAEAQLLLPQIRWYALTEDDVDMVEDYIESTSTDMLLSLGDEGSEIIRPLEFSTTRYPENCQSCPFQKMCGADALWVS
jgi:hypothetical protein